MRTVFLGILLVLCIIRPTFSQSSNNPSVEFAGFGGDGEIILKDSISIPPRKTKIARFSIPPASKHLQKDMVKIRVE